VWNRNLDLKAGLDEAADRSTRADNPLAAMAANALSAQCLAAKVVVGNVAELKGRAAKRAEGQHLH
jgi:hypothetical protein